MSWGPASSFDESRDINCIEDMGSIGKVVAILSLGVGITACASATSESGGAAAMPAAGGAGPFTAAQSSRGEATFNASCASCHAASEMSGRLFVMNWEGKPVGELFTFLRSAMPYNAPGTLSDQQYADVVAYIMRLNGHGPGATELPSDADALSRIPFHPAD